MRKERDSLGEIDVPVDCYWGAQTQRSLANEDAYVFDPCNSYSKACW
ncbi:MAG: hypothetical protein WBD50_07625 [Candidatus Rhabdochlamydia sp.]